MPLARAIYQAHLEAVSQALWDRDFETINKMMDYPLNIQLSDGQEHLDTPDKLTDWSKNFRQSLLDLGATAYFRETVAAAFSDGREDRIDGFHRVYVLKGATKLIEPYTSEGTLVLREGEWRCCNLRVVLAASRYTIDDDDEKA